jgi:hypothetical protein
MAKDRSEFDYGEDAPVKNALTKSGPAGLLLVYYLAAAVLAIIVLTIWWAFR